MKKYIDLNNKQRIEADNKFEKDFFKLMNNSAFGKTMENVEKRRDIKIVDSWESRGRHMGCRALVSRPQFRSIKYFTEDLAAIELEKSYITYDKPIYIGFTVLELSKLHMYNSITSI